MTTKKRKTKLTIDGIPQIGPEGARAWILQTHRIAPRPVARLGEWLARRPSDQDLGFARLERPGFENLRRGDIENVPLDDRPLSIAA